MAVNDLRRKGVSENLCCLRLNVMIFFFISISLIEGTNSFKPSLQFLKICAYNLSSNILQEEIVGGEEVSDKEFPWHVGIASKSAVIPFCGGTLISNRFILTAAHCLLDLSCETLVILIGYREFNSSEGFRLGLERCIVHPNYNPHNGFNDIAIAKLNQSINFQPSYFPICFPKENMNLTGKNGLAIGWGKDMEGGKRLTVLNKVTLPIISMEKCMNAYGKEKISSSMICAGWDEGGKSTCQGDSGGSFMVRLRGRWNIVGVTSWGRSCAEPDSPNVFTRIDKYYNWIIDETKFILTEDTNV